jgi:NAD dependent epimerase/dehydratase
MIKIAGKKVLITGAGGFIGSHLTEMLAKANARVTVLLRYTSEARLGRLTFLPTNLQNKLNVVFGDIRDPDICMQAVDKNDYIFHLAAQIAIPYSYIAPRDFLAVNAIGTANMLQAARTRDIKKFLHVSTSEVYGTAQYTPIDENHPQVAQSPYSASKIAADKMAQSFHLSFGLPVVTIRPFNCYGPRQSARAIIPTIILQALNGRTIKLGNISARRDMNYVTDTVNGMILSAFDPKTTGLTINLASGKDFSIEEMVDTIGDILGKRLIIKSEKKRLRPAKSEVQRLIGDKRLAERKIGYTPQISLKSGLEKTILFFEKNIDRYRQEDYQL